MGLVVRRELDREKAAQMIGAEVAQVVVEIVPRRREANQLDPGLGEARTQAFERASPPPS